MSSSAPSSSRPGPRSRSARTSSASPLGDRTGPRLALEEVERHHILAVLGQTDWVIDGPKGAATLLGLHPNTLRSRLKKLGIERASHEPS